MQYYYIIGIIILLLYYYILCKWKWQFDILYLFGTLSGKRESWGGF